MSEQDLDFVIALNNMEATGRLIRRLEKRLAQRDRRIAGLERKIKTLESLLAWRTTDLESLSRNVRREVEDALCNVRLIPVHNSRDKRIVAVSDPPPDPLRP